MDDPLREIEGLIRSSQIVSARARLEQACDGRVPRRYRSALAQLCWRAGVPERGLALLHPVVRPRRGNLDTVSPAERLEYGACLIKAGAVAEGLELVSGVEAPKHPRAYVYVAFAHVTSWEYERTIEPLLEYLKHPDPTPYERLVAEINLAQAYVLTKRTGEADERLEEILRKTSPDPFRLAVAKANEIAAQSDVAAGRWAAAREHLERSRELYRGEGGLEELFLEKWSAVVELGEKGPGPDRIARLKSVSQKARAQGHWETLRDCDRLLGIYGSERFAARHAFFGTPYPAFRALILRDLPGDDMPRSYDWRLGPGGDGGPRLEPVIPGLKRDALLSRVLATLCGDLYRPFSLNRLFQAVYPGEFFNPQSGAAKIHDAVARLRRELLGAGYPLSVVNKKGLYALEATRDCTIVLPRPETRSGDPDAIRLEELFGAHPFTIEQAGLALGLSHRSARRLLARLVAEGEVRREGKGPSTRYARKLPGERAA